MGDVLTPRRLVYAEEHMRSLVARVAKGETSARVAADSGVPEDELRAWCAELGCPALRTLRVWVPTNRHLGGKRSKPTHMDGWNEILTEYKKGPNVGAERERENLEHVAWHVRRAMVAQRWPPMRTHLEAVPVEVALTFVERDRRRDHGNIHGGAKYALDALTIRNKGGAGAIYDDSQKWLRHIGYGVSVDREHPGLAIVVRELEGRR